MSTESLTDSLKSICRRVKRSLRLLHGSDITKPQDGGLNESGFKALFQGALAEDNYHVESEFKLGTEYTDLLLTRKDAPFDTAVVVDLKYCATPFIASKHYANALHDSKQLDQLKELGVEEICKLKMFWSKGYEPVSVKTVLIAAKKQTNAFAEALLATGLFPFVLSVTVVGIGPCLVTKIETLGRVRPLLVPTPLSLFPHSHSDLHKLQSRLRWALGTLRSTDGDCDAKLGYKSGITLTGFKMILLGALHDSSFFVGSAVNMKQVVNRVSKYSSGGGKGKSKHREGRSRKKRDASERSSSAGSRSSSSSSSSSSRSGSYSRSRSRSSSASRSRSPSRSSSRSSRSSRSSTTDMTSYAPGMSGDVKHESLGTIHLLLFNDRTTPTHGVVIHFKYFPINDVHEYNVDTQSFERFGDQVFENDKQKHKRRLYLSEGLKRLSGLTREELEKVYIKNPAASNSSSSDHQKVDTVGVIARAYTSLAFRQSQAVLDKFPSLQNVMSVSVIGVGSSLLWLQEEVQRTSSSTLSAAGLTNTSATLIQQEKQKQLDYYSTQFKQKKGQTDKEYHDALKKYAKKEEEKRRLSAVNGRIMNGNSNGAYSKKYRQDSESDVEEDEYDDDESAIIRPQSAIQRKRAFTSQVKGKPRSAAAARAELLSRTAAGQGDIITMLAQKYEQGKNGNAKMRAKSQGRPGTAGNKLNQSSFF